MIVKTIITTIILTIILIIVTINLAVLRISIKRLVIFTTFELYIRRYVQSKINNNNNNNNNNTYVCN